jgi:hypothetical protein
VQGRLIPIVVAAFLAGCAETPTPPLVTIAHRPPLGERFDAAKCGAIAGEVVWAGDLPSVPPFRSIPEPFTDQPPPPPRDFANPNAPRIDPLTRTVGSAVVFLRKVDPERSRPWDHPPVRVELRDQRVEVVQGEARASVGFVRTGDDVEFVSRDRLFHSIQARGASFFARSLTKPDAPGTRRLTTPGVVELQSGAGYFWMRGYLFVVDHPYHVHGDAQGRFLLKDVPAGEYEIVAWHADWRVAETRYNPDSARIMQVTYRKPIEVSQRVVVEPAKTTKTRLELSAR